MIFIFQLIIFVGVLLRVAFFTLLERKILRLIHLRLGPNKVIIWGIFQPFSDALKLFSKEIINKTKSKLVLFLVSPLIGLILSLLCWIIYWSIYSWIYLPNFLIILFSVISLNIYSIILIGFISFRKYRIFGSYRSISQSVSYEISIILFSVTIFMIGNNLNIKRFYFIKFILPLFILLFIIFRIWFCNCLAERNRTPFDLSEGESELVRGFNTEYEGGIFSIIFISEYSRIILLSIITILIFFSELYLLSTLLLCLTFLWVRTSFPRYRYDELIILAWKVFLPLSLIFLQLLI